MSLAGCGSDGSSPADDAEPADGAIDGDAATDVASETESDATDADADADEADAEAAIPCSTVSDCPGTDTECVKRSCDANVCRVTITPKGTAVATQTKGDCQKRVCDASGAVVTENDDTDVPDDGKQCTQDVCTAGVPSNPPVGGGIACNEGGGSICNGAGACIGCTTASECPGVDDECKRRTCKSGACGFDYTSNGTPVAAQTGGDCKRNVCNGAGAIVPATDDTDKPVDGKQCTDDVCTGGVPSNPATSAGTTCTETGGKVCNGGGVCVGCTSASQCPGTDTECQTRTCNAGVCGMSYASSGTLVAAQTTGDCKKNVCNGSGAIVPQNDDPDKPVDGKQCTSDVCTSGVPSNPNLPSGTACTEGGGTKCNGSGACVQCLAPTECPGTDGPCQTRTCSAGVCGMSTKGAGAPAATQITGDCHVDLCTAAGGVIPNVDDTDKPVDGKQCTLDVCTSGVPSNPPAPAGTPCTESGGKVCNGSGACVACVVDGDCGTSDFCVTRTCNAGVCKTTNTAIGTALPTQTKGDCHEAQCDGSGATMSAVDNGDVPIDGKQCTGDICNMGVPSNPALAATTACNEGGGIACDGLGACVAAPTVTATAPADGSSAVVSPTVAITFSTAMDPTSLTAQTTAGACTGSIQVSLDNFATCIAMAAAAPTMSGSNGVATLTPKPGVLLNRAHKIRVTTAAKNAAGISMTAQYTHGTGFVAGSPAASGMTGVVISQVYGGGGNSGAPYKNDFVELHNRGTSPVSLASWTVQYGSASGTGAWSSVTLSGTIPAGGFFLVQLAGGTTGAALPTADVATSSFNMSASAGKVALVNGTTALNGACPTSSSIVDLVGWGGANCSEGTAATGPSLSDNTLAIFRAGNQCTDSNVNSADFSLAAPAPRNTASTAVSCGGTVFVQNESGTASEADWCDVIVPTPANPTAGSSVTIYGQLYEAGLTPLAGAPAGVLAQLGMGPATSNPEWETGWTWLNASYNTACSTCGTNNDEYMTTFTAVSGTYRYVYRFSVDNGASWTVCDVNGAGSNAGLTFDFADEGLMTVP
jgi:hypothetical protein